MDSALDMLMTMRYTNLSFIIIIIIITMTKKASFFEGKKECTPAMKILATPMP